MSRHDPWATDTAKRAVNLLVQAARVSPELRQAVGEVDQEIDLLRTIVRELVAENPPTTLRWMHHSRADEAYFRAFEEVGAEPPETPIQEPDNGSGPEEGE